MESRTAIVTGGGQGIGRAISLALAAKGVKVAVADINPDTAGKVADEVRAAGVEALALTVDVSRVDQLEEMVGRTAAGLGSVDILVNNAGILHTTAVEDITEPEWDRMMEINLKPVFFATQKALPHMKKRRWGRVINMSSLAGRMGGYGNGVGYSATKAGVIGLSMALARRLAPYNITVNAVAPGTTESNIIRSFSQDKIRELQAMIPLGRLGRPEDTAALCAFLASEEAGFITGAVIDINGGMFMG